MANRTCEVCGVDISRDHGRCTNGRCSVCHAAYCTPGGSDGPGHGRGTVVVSSAKAARVKGLPKQAVFHAGSGLAWRTVYDVRAWDGRTVGTVKAGHGARMVVQRSADRDRWDILAGLSVAETGGRGDF